MSVQLEIGDLQGGNKSKKQLMAHAYRRIHPAIRSSFSRRAKFIANNNLEIIISNNSNLIY